MNSVSIAPIVISCPLDKTFGFWKIIGNYTRFMAAEVRILSPNEARCRIVSPKGEPVEWLCDFIVDEWQRQIRWKTVGAPADVSVVLQFEADIDNQTKISGSVALQPGAPKNTNPKLLSRQLNTDLRNFRDKAQAGADLEEAPSTALPDLGGMSLGNAFAELNGWWQRDTIKLSSLHDLIKHPAYQAIMALGEGAIPLMLHELEKEPDHWFYALGVLTGENPVPVEDAGNMQKMANAWLAWGRHKEII